jgi:hypothetical protein
MKGLFRIHKDISSTKGIVRPFRTTTISSSSFLNFGSARNKHFIIVQWPNSDVTVRADEPKTLKEQHEMLHDIAEYAESQTQRIYNLQTVDSKRSQLEFSQQPSRLLDSILSEKESDKSVLLEQSLPSTYNKQLNLITLIDRSPVDDANQWNKLIKIQEEKIMKQIKQQKQQQQKQKTSPKDMQQQQQQQTIEEDEHGSPIVK